MTTPERRNADVVVVVRRALLALLVVAPMLVLAPVGSPPGPAVAGAASTGDGTSPETAAPSCWAIKQRFPTTASGVFWLQTPALVFPQQFSCDMVSDGGGWVLVGRGREGWSFRSGGQRTAFDIWSKPAGPTAFPPAALPASTIDALIGGGRVDSLPDGVRVRRAANAAGTAFQEMRLDFADLGGWAWGWGAGMYLDSVSVGGTRYAGGNTADTMDLYGGQTLNQLQGVNDARRMTTELWSYFGWRMGFAYGRSVCGATADGATHLFDATGDGCFAMPFTQVWLRPRLLANDVEFAPIPPAGFDATSVRAMLDPRPARTSWGVRGAVMQTHWLNHEVQVWGLTEIGGTLYVGGKFDHVENFDTGEVVRQRFLAAFDRATGAYVRSFAPTLDGPVYDLDRTPDGRLVVGGEFTSVGGAPRTKGLAVLDPVTGAVDAGWQSDVDRLDESRVLVGDLEVEGPWLYLGGEFEAIRRTGQPDLRVYRIARVDASTGRADAAWRPAANAAVIAVDATPEQVHLVGHFSAVNGSSGTGNQATVRTSDGQTVTGLAPFQPTRAERHPYQQDVLQVGDSLFVGGSEHDLQRQEAADHVLTQSHVTRGGGDFQTIAEVDGVVYAACHCNQWSYQGANNYPEPRGYDATSKVNYLLAFDSLTGDHLAEFVPEFSVSSFAEGPWETFRDSTGCLWVGGDVAGGAWNGSSFDPLSGFGKLCPRDTTPPARPAGFSASVQGPDAKLTWSGGADPEGGTVEYEILRDDRVIRRQAARTYTDVGISTGHTYAVRSVDAQGNRSATTLPSTLHPLRPPLATILPTGQTWSYRASGTFPGPGWNAAGFDLSAWPTGPAELGWGDGGEATLLPSGPITHWFARDVQVPVDVLAETRHLRLSVRRDDGVAVYVNGLEVLRSYLPPGPVTPTTRGSVNASGADESTPVVIELPPDLLQPGTNRVAAELHQAYASNPDGSFDLSLTAHGDDGDPNPPTTFSATTTDVTATTATLRWTTAADDSAVAGYLLSLDGARVAYVAPTTSSWALTGLEPESRHEATVTAYDLNGNATTRSTAFTTPRDPVRLPFGSAWRYRYDGADPGVSWRYATYDDSAWAAGPGQLGFGDGDEGTVIGASGHLVAYFRSSVPIDDPAAIGGLRLEVVRDDGVIVYVNGVEAGRDNLPAGAVGHGTFAGTAIFGAGEKSPVTFVVPSSALHAGPNTVAVAVHQDWRGSPDLSFDLRATEV